MSDAHGQEGHFMRPIPRAVHGIPWGGLILLLIPFIWFHSCLPLAREHGEGAPERDSAVKRQTFRSDRYLVCVPGETTTAVDLAGRYLDGPEKAWVIEEANGRATFSPADTVVIPLSEENPGGLEKEGYQTVPILCYHRFARENDGLLCVSEEAFADQMAFLADNGYRTIGVEDLLGFLNYRRGLPKRSVLITIDDGYRSAYEIAFPILVKHGFTATLFVYTDFINTSVNSLTWEQLREMKDAGFEVGSHTVTHCDLSKPDGGEARGVYRERVKRELLVSKQTLDERLAQDTIALAFPFGGTTPEILQMCHSLGYRLGVTLRPGANPFFADPLALRREQISGEGGAPFKERLKLFESASLQ
jgi:peptidoglycan/xylan/chitin deacetylase (PgdA/CDA1 family)